MKKNGFTLIELLAVIVILGLLMAIAIPSVTKYITQSRKKTVTTTIGNYISALTNQVNDMEYTFTATNTVYAVPIECIALERGGTNPFGKWHQATDTYWAYVLVEYDDKTSSYTYGFTFKDSAGYGIYPTTTEKLNESGKQINTDLDLTRPTNGYITNITGTANWTGFDVKDDTNLVVLEATSEGETGNGQNTCTLCQKGNNYEVVEEEKVIKAVPKVSLKVTAENNKLVVTGIFENFNESTKYYDVTKHGILYIEATRLGTRTLTTNTTGRTNVNFSGYNTDGSFLYRFKPTSTDTIYALKSYLIYIDPNTGENITVYSNMTKTSYDVLTS